MEKAQVIKLEKGMSIKLDLAVVGYVIEGPATVIVLKEEAAEATSRNYNQNLINRESVEDDRSYSINVADLRSTQL